MTAGQETPTLYPNKPQGAQSYGYKEARKLQILIMKDAENPETPALVRASLARAWDVLEDRKRVLKMRPKPADMPVDPAALLKALKRAKVRAGGQASLRRVLGPIIEADAGDEPTPTKTGQS